MPSVEISYLEGYRIWEALEVAAVPAGEHYTEAGIRHLHHHGRIRRVPRERV